VNTKNIFHLLVSLTAAGGLTCAGLACDSCALYIAEGAGRPGFTLSVAGQFTRLGTVWQGADRQPNPVDQYLNSSITQLTLGYSRGGPWSLQFTLPYIRRSWLRPDHALLDRGTESGLGDATLAARFQLWRRETAHDTFALHALAGVKFATGDSDHLGDEIGHHFHHHTNYPDSGIHGHDLAFGSGSTDYVLGTDALWRHGWLFARGQLQYKLRRPGAFDYRLADETSWELGVGGYMALTHEHSLAVQALFSAEHKGLDQLAGDPQEDTGFSARYMGGRITGSLGERLSADVALELPVRLRTSETMVVPDYRLRAAVTWRF
jgi:hypothetical protein